MNNWTVFNKPYEKDGKWFVEVVEGSNAPRKFSFNTEDEANEFFKESVMPRHADKPIYNSTQDQWEVCYFDLHDDTNPHIKSFDKEKDAFGFSESSLPLNKKQKSKIKEMASKDTTFLDNMADGLLPSNMDQMLHDAQNLPEEINDIEDKIKEYKDEFDAKKNECEEKAKGILGEVAKLYVGEKYIKEHQYVEFKLQVDQMGLASLIFQLETAHKTLFRLTQEIHIGPNGAGQISARLIEVQAQLQRVVLDTTKFLHEYIVSIEEGLKRLREDIENITGETSASGDGVEEEQLIFYRSTKKLNADLNSFTSELDKFKQIAKPSKNALLREKYNEPEPEDIEIEEDKSDEEDIEGSGLESWDDDNT